MPVKYQESIKLLQNLVGEAEVRLGGQNSDLPGVLQTVEYDLAALKRNVKGDAAVGEQLQESRRRLGQITVHLDQVIDRAGELQKQIKHISS